MLRCGLGCSCLNLINVCRAGHSLRGVSIYSATSVPMFSSQKVKRGSGFRARQLPSVECMALRDATNQ